MAWIYNSNTGAILDIPQPFASFELSSGLGWHGPFGSHDEAVQFYEANKAANPGWKGPTSSVGQAIQNATESGVQRITGTDKINWDVWFLRVGEVILGVVLIAVGLAKLTGTTNAIAKAVKVAL